MIGLSNALEKPSTERVNDRYRYTPSVKVRVLSNERESKQTTTTRHKHTTGDDDNDAFVAVYTTTSDGQDIPHETDTLCVCCSSCRSIRTIP